ncbi:MAG: hypothetical protein ACUVX9_06180 [Anaerolineae bacterium]
MAGYVAVAELAYVGGALLGNALSRSTASGAHDLRNRGRWQPTLVRRAALLLVLAGTAAALSIVARSGPAILRGVAESGLLVRASAGPALVVCHLGWIGACLYSVSDLVEQRTIGRRAVGVLLAMGALLSVVGYRTYLAMMLVVVALCAYYLSRFSRATVLLCAAGVVGASLVVLWLCRFGVEWGGQASDVLSLVQAPAIARLMVPLYLIAREGTSHSYRITQMLGSGEYWRGRLLIADVLTILPGRQWSGGQLVAQLLGGTGIAGLAPSLLGALYLDFGSVGIAAAMLLLGCLAALLHARAVLWGSPSAVLLYSYYVAFQLHFLNRGVFAVEYLLCFAALYLVTWHLDRCASVGREKQAGGAVPK